MPPIGPFNKITRHFRQDCPLVEQACFNDGSSVGPFCKQNGRFKFL
jgi:hypothetical protein